jgi:hypothetical protein
MDLTLLKVPKMVYRKFIKKALMRTWRMEKRNRAAPAKVSDSRSSVTSRLVYDILGGEILKTHLKKGWYFYNRIDGQRLDFNDSETGSIPTDIRFEDIPSSPDETLNYFPEEDYSSLFIRFVRTFEEVVGLRRLKTELSV